MKRTQVLEMLKARTNELRKRFHISYLDIFGSVARDEASLDSDVEILVVFEEPPGLFGFVQLKKSLEEMLSCQVDLVTKNALKPQLRDSILKDFIRVA
ncbi:MAG: nucleotidyltransferase family protein [Ectothiorhodospiraceae bacterium]|nr:nucleotidyltransferase family protein [Ectothiorhodospiraceae bacterium]